MLLKINSNELLNMEHVAVVQIQGNENTYFLNFILPGGREFQSDTFNSKDEVEQFLEEVVIKGCKC